MDPNFLRLCGFDAEEVEREASRIERSFEILEIGPDDVEEGAKRILHYFDVRLNGVRKALGIWVRELTDMVLAREEKKKIVYASFPPTYQLMAAMSSVSENIYCIIPEIVLCTTLGCIFNRINPVLEVAEEHGLAPGNAFCSFLQTRLGAMLKGIIPMPDLLVPSCLICDQSPKVDELLHELFGIPIAYVDNIIDDKGDRWPDDISPRRIEYLAMEMKDATEMFSSIFGHRISDETAGQAIQGEGRLFSVANKLWNLMKADPMPLSVCDLEICRRIASICSRRALRDGLEALNILYDEAQKRIEDGFGVMEKGAPRIMFTMLPFDPEIVHMVEELKLSIGVTALVPTPTGVVPDGYTSVWEDVADSILRRRGANYCSLAYILQVRELASLWNVDGVIVFHHIGCRQYNAWTLKAREIIQGELNIPVLLLEGDYCDFRNYSVEQIRLNVETFAQVVKNSKAARSAEA